MSGNFVGPPLLQDFVCEVKTNKSTNENFGTGTPIVFLQLKINDASELAESSNRTVSMELDPNGLDALLDGLHRIQIQLSNVANKQSRS